MLPSISQAAVAQANANGTLQPTSSSPSSKGAHAIMAGRARRASAFDWGSQIDFFGGPAQHID